MKKKFKARYVIITTFYIATVTSFASGKPDLKDFDKEVETLKDFPSYLATPFLVVVAIGGFIGTLFQLSKMFTVSKKFSGKLSWKMKQLFSLGSLPNFSAIFTFSNRKVMFS